MADTVLLFREWCGDEQFAKFVGALQTTCRRRGALLFWQEALWERFCGEKQLQLPRDYVGVSAIFASVAEVGGEVAFEFPADGPQQSTQTLRARLLDWADRRAEAHLGLSAELVLKAAESHHQAVAALVQQLFHSDNDIRQRFKGVTVSVRIRTPDGRPPVTGLTLGVSSSAQEPPVSLGWAIGLRPKP